MEDQLLQSLHDKLCELEHKTQTFRRDMVASFQLYHQDLLRDVAPAVATNIRQRLARSLTDHPSKYPALGPELQAADADAESQSPDHSPRSPTFQSPPPPTAPVTPAAVFGGDEVSGNRREREIELQGLFTPSFLPLLESAPDLPKPVPAAAVLVDNNPFHAHAHAHTQANITVPVASHSPPLPEPSAGQCAAMDAGQTEPSDGLGVEPDQSQSSANQPLRLADDTISSASSDKSDSKPPRSALRRSSSLSKVPQSPRRVRFEFMGAEVLPTASPQPAEFIAPPPPSPPTAETDTASSDFILGNEAEEYMASMPPRKISSSDALRALSRTPMEEGTVWTVVNPDFLDQATQAQRPSSPDTPATSHIEEVVSSTAEPEMSSISSEASRQWASLENVEEERAGENDSDDSSDEEFLAMARPKSKPSQRASVQSSHVDSARRTPAHREPDAGQEEDEDDMFHFETGNSASSPQLKAKPTPANQEESEDESDDAQTETTTRPAVALYATSPAVTISRPSEAGPTSPTIPAIPATPTTPSRARFQVGSIGSYKGRSVIMPVVRDPLVHARAVSLGDFNSFVGSVDGRTGLDESDLNSFRASLAQSGFAGTPRSLAERMMIEEAQEELARKDATPPQGG